jgi:putative transposase
MIVQTYGHNGQYSPHLHFLATSGGWDQQAQQWIPLDNVPYRMLLKKWPWYLLSMVRQTVKTKAIDRLVEACYQSYREGFVTNVQKGNVPTRAMVQDRSYYDHLHDLIPRVRQFDYPPSTDL